MMDDLITEELLKGEEIIWKWNPSPNVGFTSFDVFLFLLACAMGRFFNFGKHIQAEYIDIISSIHFSEKNDGNGTIKFGNSFFYRNV